MLIKKYFLPPALKKSIKSFKERQLEKTNRKVFNNEGIVPLFIQIGVRSVRALPGFVENLAVDVLLGTLVIERCICRKIPAEREIITWPSRLISIITRKTAIN